MGAYSLLGTQSFLTACSSPKSKDTSEVEKIMETPNLFFKISLAQWSLHKSIFGEKLMQLDWPERTALLNKDVSAALCGEIKPLDFAKIARSFEIEAIEYVSIFYKDKAQNQAFLNEMKDRADSEGIKSLLIMVDAEGNLGDADETQRNQAVENHYQWVNAAKFLGCHSIRVNAAGEGTADEVKQAAVDGLGKLTEYGAQNEINIIVENHGGYSSNGTWLSDVMRQVNSPYCGTLPDFGNFKIDEGQFYDPYQGIKELMPFAKGVSAKSYDFDTSKEGFITMGARNTMDQELDYLKLLKIVKEAGYTGYIGIEYEGNILSEMDGIHATKDLLERAGRAL